MLENLLLNSPESYNYLSNSQCFKVKTINDEDEFSITMEAMTAIGIKDETQLEILKMLSGILWLGNINFEKSSSSKGIGSKISNDSFDGKTLLLTTSLTPRNRGLTSRHTFIHPYVSYRLLSTTSNDNQRIVCGTILYQQFDNTLSG